MNDDSFVVVSGVRTHTTREGLNVSIDVDRVHRQFVWVADRPRTEDLPKDIRVALRQWLGQEEGPDGTT